MTERIAIVTGSARGIGAATARRLAEDGMAVANAILYLFDERAAQRAAASLDAMARSGQLTAFLTDLPASGGFAPNPMRRVPAG